MNNERCIVGSRVSEGPSPVRGAVTVPCLDCKQPVWVSPALHVELANGSSVRCLQCILSLDLSKSEFEVTPATKAETREALGCDVDFEGVEKKVRSLAHG